MVHWKQGRYGTVLLALLGLCQATLPPPRMSFSIGSTGRTITVLNRSDVGDTTMLLLSDDEDTLFVGARNAVLVLNVSNPDVMEMRKKLDWVPSSDDIKECYMRRQNKGDCQNFIRVLQFLNSSHMFACGTFAYSPHCAYIDVQTLAFQSKVEKGKGRCPYSPYRRNTATVVDGELYVGTWEDFRETEPAISRYLSQAGRPDMRFDSLPNWLENPSFINSAFIPSEEKVFYFLTEDGTEYKFAQKYTVSRIAQVCTSDVGGERILQNRWTTFAKAQLQCLSDGHMTFNIMQDVVMLPPPEGANPDETLFYGVFSSQWSVTSGQSAVCKFKLKDIKKVFSGKYMELNRATKIWRSKTLEKTATPGQCDIHSQPDNILSMVKENFLAEESVKPQGQALISLDQRYSRIAAQRTKAASGSNYIVLFLLTESGFLHKMVLLPKGPYVIEEVQMFEQPQSIKTILLSVKKGTVFVGSQEGVFQVPVSNCSFYQTCEDCILARDPFCGWDISRSICADISSIPGEVYQDVEGGSIEPCKKFRRYKARFIEATPEEERNVELNKMVELQCPKASNLAKLQWEDSNGRLLSQDIYLQLTRGSLRFLATCNTLGQYRCVSVENGHRRVLSNIVVQRMSITKPDFCMSESSYFVEMVVVSVLLAVCGLAVVGLCVWRTKACPRMFSRKESEAKSLHELHPLGSVSN